MRYAILGDIHSNLAAFQAVLEDAEKRGGFDKILCLGDIVGYGPDPHECIELLQQYDHVCVAGNHDWAAAEKIDTLEFNPDAASANHWTTQNLTDDDKEYLGNLPLSLEEGDITLVHGSLRSPIWEYLLSVTAARDNFALLQTRYCLTGHSHIPQIFEYIDCSVFSQDFSDTTSLVLSENSLIINPGSVGQPRDSDPRASYALYDDEIKTIYHYRTDYDIAATQEKMLKEGLPERLITRLNFGW